MSEASNHLDLDALKELKSIMGDEYTLLVETFLNDSTQRLQVIADAVAAGDPEALRRAAHSFKGSAGNMGAIPLSRICKSLEELGGTGSLDQARQLLQDMELEYQQVSRALQAI